MPYCEYCGEEIGYLPFKCKYCGSTHCKKHRLPENHQCSFELKHVPIVQVSESKGSSGSQTEPVKTPQPKTRRSRQTKDFERYIERQERQEKEESKHFKSRSYGRPSFKGTKILLITILILTILGMIFPLFFRFSLHMLLYEYMFHTVITSLFIAPTDFTGLFGIINLFFFGIMMFFTYFISRSLEYIKGTKFLFQLYIISACFSLLVYLVLRVLFDFIYPIQFRVILAGFVYGGIFGLMAYSIFPVKDQSLTALVYFIPMRMKGRSFLIVIILLRVLPGLLFALLYLDPLPLIIYIPDIGGILGAFIMYKYQRNQNRY